MNDVQSGWMQFDLTRLTPGEIAVLGAIVSLITAFAAGVSSLVSTYVKGRMDARAAAVVAHREFLSNEFRPLIEYIRTRIHDVTMLRSAFETQDADSKDVEVFREKVAAYLKAARANALDPLTTVLAQRRAFLVKAVARWQAAELEGISMLADYRDGQRSLDQATFKEYSENLVLAGVFLHEAIQRVIFVERLSRKIPYSRT